MTKLTFVFSLLLTLATTLSAQQDTAERGGEKPSTSEIFEKMDTNQDGFLAESEVKGPLQKDFAQLDTDQDGYLSASEIERAPKRRKRKKMEQNSSDENNYQAEATEGDQSQKRKKRRGGDKPTTSEIFERMDKNQDGLLAESEVKGPLQKDFEKIDTNADGFLDADEIENAPRPERGRRPRNN